MINVLLENNNDTMILKLPQSICNLQKALRLIGCQKAPEEVMLFATGDSEVRVQLYGDNDCGNHLCRLFTEQDSLLDVNHTVYLLQKTDGSIQTELEQDILYDQYDSAEELLADISERIRESEQIQEGPKMGGI